LQATELIGKIIRYVINQEEMSCGVFGLNLMELRKWFDTDETRTLSNGISITPKSTINERHKVLNIVYDSNE
jgi:hypothetical protein